MEESVTVEFIQNIFEQKEVEKGVRKNLSLELLEFWGSYGPACVLSKFIC